MTDKTKSAGPVIGALGLGVISSACCTLPFVAVTAGVGGAWITSFSWLEPYRWWFVAAAALLLGIATIREVRSSQSSHCDCEDGMSPRARRTLLVVGAILTAGFALSPEMIRAEEGGVATSGESELHRVVLAVEGMTCDSCTTTVRRLLEEVDGAEVVTVTYEPPHATVDIVPSETEVSELVAAIESIGYTATLVWEADRVHD